MKLYLIDLDGVLLDSLGVWSAIDRDFVMRYNLANPEAIIERLRYSPSLIDAGIYLHNECNHPASPEAIAQEFEDLLQSYYANTLELFPGVTEALLCLKNTGAKLALITASPSTHAIPALKRTGIFHFFDAIRTNESKSTPDVFLSLAFQFNISPHESLVIDDNPHCLFIAYSAGFCTQNHLI